MLLRVERDAKVASILSFPRDLWVKVAGSSRRGRINATFDEKDPSRLVQTIEENFGIRVDHYVGRELLRLQETRPDRGRGEDPLHLSGP